MTSPPTSSPSCKDRGLSTARAVLRVLSLISQNQRGVSAREVADRLQKSLSTAYHLLASLEAEGFVVRAGRAGCYQLATGGSGVKPVPSDLASPELEAQLVSGMHQLFALTGRRTGFGIISADGVALVQDVGRQGLPRMGNLEKPLICATAHALAVGKVLLAGLDDTGLQHWTARHGLTAFTSATIVDPVVLQRELADVRRCRVAADRGEFDPDFGSLAAAVLDQAGRPVAVLSITVTRHQFDAEQDGLRAALLCTTGDIMSKRAG